MILVTGANGTVGSELTRQLSAKGHRVRAMVRRIENAAKIPRDHVDVVGGDFSSSKSLDSAMEGVDAITFRQFAHDFSGELARQVA
jgi:uncharacterized protein YbjT (DUF2867 family)